MSTNDTEVEKAPAILIAAIVLGVALAGLAVYMWAARGAAPAASPGAAAFVQTCVLPAAPADARCRSKADIQSAWGLDVDAMIEERRTLMVATVKRMLNGELSRRGIYESCIMQGQCAPVPLLPDGTDPNAVAAGNEFLDTRKAFWQLAADSPLTPEICGFMDICRAMRAAGVITVQ